MIKETVDVKEENELIQNTGGNENVEPPMIVKRTEKLHNKCLKSTLDVHERKKSKECLTDDGALEYFISQPGSSKQLAIMDRMTAISSYKTESNLKTKSSDRRNSEKNGKVNLKAPKLQYVDSDSDNEIVVAESPK